MEEKNYKNKVFHWFPSISLFCILQKNHCLILSTVTSLKAIFWITESQVLMFTLSPQCTVHYRCSLSYCIFYGKFVLLLKYCKIFPLCTVQQYVCLSEIKLGCICFIFSMNSEYKKKYGWIVSLTKTSVVPDKKSSIPGKH